VAGDGSGVGAELRGVAAGLAAVLIELAELVVEGVEGDLELRGDPDEGRAWAGGRENRRARARCEERWRWEGMEQAGGDGEIPIGLV
jgi:hypothetical protein